MSWYLIFGFMTLFIGVFRGLRGKQHVEPDELTVLSWFLVWPIWLIVYFMTIVKTIKLWINK
jgi:hypothetical protein